ncbi:hypothetical protein ACFWBS_59435, partial [Streptomyces mirabilis]|uniref:hypothetical protein n=1 Tax=Streptomyces mirabilis TaxID=68239 RepID=UPI003657DF24
MGSKDEPGPVESEHQVRTGAELARIAEKNRDLAEELVERARRDGRPLRAWGDAFTVRDVKIFELDRARLKKWAGQRIPGHAKAEVAVGCAVRG